MGRDRWYVEPDRRLTFWILICAVLFFLLGMMLFLLTGFGHFFAFGLLSVGLVGWLYGRWWGMISGLFAAAVTTTLMLGLDADPGVIVRDNLMYLAMAVVLGGAIGEIADANRALRAAHLEIKTLRGFIPICASCKNVRDDHGYWTQVEVYVSQHSGAEFTHGLCPACTEGMLADLPPRPTPQPPAVH